MEYKLHATSMGPVIVGEDEVLSFQDFNAMLDYQNSDPEFLNNLRKFVHDGLIETATNVAKGIYEPMVGGDITPMLYGYLNARHALGRFEEFLFNVQR